MPSKRSSESASKAQQTSSPCPSPTLSNSSSNSSRSSSRPGRWRNAKEVVMKNNNILSRSATSRSDMIISSSSLVASSCSAPQTRENSPQRHFFAQNNHTNNKHATTRRSQSQSSATRTPLAPTAHATSKHFRITELMSSESDSDDVLLDDNGNRGGGMDDDDDGVVSSSSKKRFQISDDDDDHSAVRHSFLGSLARYPLLLFVLLAILVNLIVLIIVQSIVTFWEYTFVWRGQRRKLRAFMSWSQNYEEWKQAAATLDEFMGHDQWKAKRGASKLYNSDLIQKSTRRLRRLRLANEASASLRVLFHACKRGHGGITNASLYSRSYIGTQVTVERFYEEVLKSLEFIEQTDQIPQSEKIAFFGNLAKSYGRTALCLSGGSSLVFNHMGVLKAFFDEGLLPDVITGASAGALIAAMVCCRTDEEIRRDRIFEPEIATTFRMLEDSWAVRLQQYYKTGALFDPDDGFKKCEFATAGHLTFLEAYKKTGRILCISVVPDEPGTLSPVKTLNYITAPDVVISSAICATCAIPGVLPAGILVCKSPTGEYFPYRGSGKRWRDGSIRSDIPDLSLFNVGFTIVSQVNPHITPFFFESKGSPGSPIPRYSGSGWRGGFLASSISHHVDLDLKKWWAFIRDLHLLPPIMGADLSSLFLQKFEGSVTILPAASTFSWAGIQGLLRIVTDPDPAYMKDCIERGRLVTYPKLGMVRDVRRVELAISRIRQRLRPSVA